MFNENRMELLNNLLIREIGNAINQRHPDNHCDISDENDVFKRLPDLYDEQKEIEFGQETGKSYKYMPKQYKAMVMRLVAPGYTFSYRVNDCDTAITVEAYLYLDLNDQKPIATGEATVAYDSVGDSEMSEYEKRKYAKSTAKGLAESKAFQKFGIGSWYSYRFEPEEEPDVAAEHIRQQNESVPVIAYEKSVTTTATVTKENTPVEITDKDKDMESLSPAAPASDIKEQETVQVSEDKNESEITPIESALAQNSDDVANSHSSNEKTDSSAISLEEARNMIPECGKAKEKGLNLGQTADQFPANLVWLYTRPEVSDLQKQAIKVIADSNADIKELFIQKALLK